jgi:hypothetical protein
MQTKLDLTADIIDLRDIIARYEELEDDVGGYENPQGDLEKHDADLAKRYELASLAAILDELKGNGGDEQWRGDWYPLTLICDSYFTDYARELLEDCGTIPRDMPSWVEIDWDATARNVRMDYTPIDIDGVTYWYR